MKGPAESGQICSVGRRKIAKKIAKNKRCYANTLRPRSRMLLKVMKGGFEVLAGRDVPEAAEPIAMAYAGHQFGHFVPQLGDGRAILLGEVIDQQGVRRDIQLKGSGRTPFSRGGDGRAALGPALREYVVSEAMAA